MIRKNKQSPLLPLYLLYDVIYHINSERWPLRKRLRNDDSLPSEYKPRQTKRLKENEVDRL